MIEYILLLISALFTVLIILLNIRFNAKEGLFILSTVVALTVLIIQFILINVISATFLKSLTHLIVLIIYTGIIIFQICNKFSSGKLRKSQKKFLKERRN